MGQINWSRVILGGLVAGLVMNVSEYIMTLPAVLGTAMQAELTNRNLPPMGNGVMAFYIIMAFIVGFLTIWMYAAMRPRYGAGPKTAIYAGLAVWILAFVRSRIGHVAIGLFSLRLMVLAGIWGLVEMILASLAGARLYRE